MKRIAKFFLVLMIMGIIAVSVESAHRVKRIMGHLQPTATPAPPSATPSDVRATQEHLSHSKTNYMVKKYWGPEIAKHRHLMETILQREKDHENDYYVLYHGQSNDFRPLQDFLYMLYQWDSKTKSKTKLPNDFIFLRWWEKRPTEEDVQSWLDKYYSVKFSDVTPVIADALLSVNFALFGHVTDFLPTSATFEYFVSERGGPSTIPILQNIILKYYGFNLEHVQDLRIYSKEIRADSGTLWQIFVPKQLGTKKPIDQYVYLSKPLGHPAGIYSYKDGIKVAPTDFDRTKNRYIRCSGVLDARLENPQKFDSNVYDTMQGRLYMPAAKGGPLDPWGGFKIFRYTAMSPTEEEAYKKKMITLFNTMTGGKDRSGQPIVYTLPTNPEVKIGSAVQTLVDSLVGSTSTSTSSSSSSSFRPASSAVPPKPAPSTPVHAAVAITPGAAAQAARSAVYHQRHQATPWWRQRLDHYYTTTLNWLKSWIK